MHRKLMVHSTPYSLPSIVSEDGEIVATDRVFNGYEHLFAASPLLRTMLGRLLDEVMMSEDVFTRIAPLTLEQCRNALAEAGK